MQTFLPLPDFTTSAKCLDNRRLGKQRVETLQLLKALKQGPIILYDSSTKEYLYDCGSININSVECRKLFEVRKTPWFNHPACQMWLGYEFALIEYGVTICKEWIGRGFKDTCLKKIEEFRSFFQETTDYPPFVGNAEFHLSHQSNLVRKDFSFYSPQFPGVPNNLEYVWLQ